MKRLNVLKYGYLSWRRPIHNIGQFFRNIRYAYQRITKGYCDYDLWSLYNYYTVLFNSTLNELVDTTHGWPQSDKFPEFEDWQKYIKDIAQHFQNSDEDYKYFLPNWFEKIAYDTYTYTSSNDPKWLIILRDRWLEKSDEAYKAREQEKNIAFDMLKEVFFSLWD